MRIEPELILHRKENFLMSSGKVIVVASWNIRVNSFNFKISESRW